MPSPDELIAAVTARTEDTPYEVVRTAEGFDLRIRLADARWYGALGAGGRSKVVQHRVRLDAEKARFTIVDDHYDLDWSAGASGPVPKLKARVEMERFQGRKIERSFEKTWGVDAKTGEPGLVVDYSFSSAEGHRMIREPATSLGWRERMGGAQVAGIAVAGSVGGIAAVAGIVLAALAATGRL